MVELSRGAEIAAIIFGTIGGIIAVIPSSINLRPLPSEGGRKFYDGFTVKNQ